MRSNQYDRDDNGTMIMNQHNIAKICEKEGQDHIEDMNTKLYLHFKGFRKIENLAPYINLKVLWLENNFLTKIEGLESLLELTHLFLHNNLIDEIQGLEKNLNIRQINLESNCIKKIQNISHLSLLQNLNLSNNKLQSFLDVEQIVHNTEITTLELKNNHLTLIRDNIDVVSFHKDDYYELDSLLKVFIGMKSLNCLYLQSNEYVRDFVNYRKVYIGRLEKLTYLDTSPVNVKERRLSTAYVLGGKKAMRIESDCIDAEILQQKQANSEEVRKTLPKNLQNKVIFFQRTYDEGMKELENLRKTREQEICRSGPAYQVQYTEDLIFKKEQELSEINIMIENMKNRAGIPTTTLQVQTGNKDLQQQEYQDELDQLD